MQYEVIIEKGNYALIKRGSRMEEYAVVNGLNKETGEWGWTCCYYNFGNYSPIDKATALFLALDYFRMRTETDYIPRCRLEELATQFKDGLIEDDEEQALIYFDEVCEMEDYEKEFSELKRKMKMMNIFHQQKMEIIRQVILGMHLV